MKYLLGIMLFSISIFSSEIQLKSIPTFGSKIDSIYTQYNTINGASVTGVNKITLPEGTYIFIGYYEGFLQQTAVGSLKFVFKYGSDSLVSSTDLNTEFDFYNEYKPLHSIINQTLTINSNTDFYLERHLDTLNGDNIFLGGANVLIRKIEPPTPYIVYKDIKTSNQVLNTATYTDVLTIADVPVGEYQLHAQIKFDNNGTLLAGAKVRLNSSGGTANFNALTNYSGLALNTTNIAGSLTELLNVGSITITNGSVIVHGTLRVTGSATTVTVQAGRTALTGNLRVFGSTGTDPYSFITLEKID